MFLEKDFYNYPIECKTQDTIYEEKINSLEELSEDEYVVVAKLRKEYKKYDFNDTTLLAFRNSVGSLVDKKEYLLWYEAVLNKLFNVEPKDMSTLIEPEKYSDPKVQKAYESGVDVEMCQKYLINPTKCPAARDYVFYDNASPFKHDKFYHYCFYQRLKTLRVKKGYTQQEVANMMGKKQTEIALYESGSRYPNEATIKALAVIYDVTYDEIVYGNDQIKFQFNYVEKDEDVYGYKLVAEGPCEPYVALSNQNDSEIKKVIEEINQLLNKNAIPISVLHILKDVINKLICSFDCHAQEQYFYRTIANLTNENAMSNPNINTLLDNLKKEKILDKVERIMRYAPSIIISKRISEDSMYSPTLSQLLQEIPRQYIMEQLAANPGMENELKEIAGYITKDELTYLNKNPEIIQEIVNLLKKGGNATLINFDNTL